MRTSDLEYKRAFDAYLRRGVPIELALKQDRATTHYIWRTRDDERVRPSHAANNGKIFAWDNPPPTGHPGEDYGCRCTAEPYQPVVADPANIAGNQTTSPPTELVPPVDGLFGTLWRFQGGRTALLVARSTNPIGFVGVRAFFRVYQLDENGNIVAEVEPSRLLRSPYTGETATQIPPMLTDEMELIADFDSPYGYYWIVKAESACTVDNESYIFFNMYR